MANPWLKKNPFMSMFLSGANAVAGSMRASAAAQAKRAASQTVTEVTKAMFAMPAAPRKSPAKRKRR